MEPETRAPDPAAALNAAVKANDAAAVGRLLAQHPELKSKLDEPLPGQGFGGTALHGAVQRGNREMIDLLLRAGANINQRSHWWAGGFGVLDDAWRAPWLPAFLVERGAVVDIHAAVRLGMREKVAELLAADPHLVHARGGDGQTPLHFAHTVDDARYLLAHGADIDARDIDHESTPAQYMVRDRQEVARYLVERGCRTDLLLATALGDLARVGAHLDADPSCLRMSVSEQYFPKQDPRGGGTIYIWCLGAHKTAPMVAREFGHEEIFRLLMERTPQELKLAQACELGDEEAFKALLAERPDLARTFSEDDRRRVANAAAQNNNTAAVRLLLAAGGWPAGVHGQHTATPLHWAAFHGNAEMTREILRHHPPLELRDAEYDAPPLGWACYGSQHGWHRETGDYVATVEALLAAGAVAPPLTDDLEASEPVREVLRRLPSKPG